MRLGSAVNLDSWSLRDDGPSVAVIILLQSSPWAAIVITLVTLKQSAFGTTIIFIFCLFCVIAVIERVFESITGRPWYASLCDRVWSPWRLSWRTARVGRCGGGGGRAQLLWRFPRDQPRKGPRANGAGVYGVPPTTHHSSGSPASAPRLQGGSPCRRSYARSSTLICARPSNRHSRSRCLLIPLF